MCLHLHFKSKNYLRFSVFALGNSSYPKFCSCGIQFDSLLHSLGAERIYDLALGDELAAQEESFRNWALGVFKASVDIFCITADCSVLDSLSQRNSLWTQQYTRLSFVERDDFQTNTLQSLSKWHNRKISTYKLIGRKSLRRDENG